ncbi:MAG: shikimate dehydrogenase [Herpetosiphon sp.]
MSQSALGGSGAVTTGLIGWPVRRSLSAAMHNAAFAACGIYEQYALWETQEPALAERVELLRQEGMRGANVTIPHKVAVATLLDELDAEAQAMGAVNTITRTADGRLVGSNTDGAGFMVALREFGVDAMGARVVVLGAGGAARAVAYHLVLGGVAQLTLVNRTLAHAEEVLGGVMEATARDAALHALQSDDAEAEAAVAQATLLVNASPVGADGVGMPVPARWLRTDLAVCDLIYRSTPLLEAAKACGARATDGLEMLIQQAALSFAGWTQREAPVKVMRAAGLAARDGAAT